jgi:xylitol oxidase
VVARAPRIRVLGSRHSFSDIADSDQLVTVDRLPAAIEIDHDRHRVTCAAATSYGELAIALEREQLALANLASLPHISIAGAISTATHGSGTQNGNLATAVEALELVSSDGRLHELRRGDPDFDGTVVALGALGALTRVTLQVEPLYEVRQRVFEPLRWEALFAHLEEIMASGYSVSVFTMWGRLAGHVWVKQRVGQESVGDELFGAPALRVERHPIDGLDPVHATQQLGAPGPWFDRLPHFRMGFTPSSGAELQSEYLVARRDGIEALRAVQGIATVLRPLLLVSEIRAVAADSLWLSPQYDRDTIGIHFTWKREPGAVRRALAEVERVLAPFAARPHWGKLFLAGAAEIAPLYERLPAFRDLLGRLDPRRAFSNDWLERHLLGAPT